MDGLRSARVLVVDNEIAEAGGFMQALAKEGIGSVWYSGEINGLPDRPLRGIRLAAIDLDLGGAGATDVGQTITTLERLVDSQNGPYLAIAWTKHKDLVEEFTLKAATLPCPPVIVIPLLKSDVRDTEGAFDFASIAHNVRDALENAYPLGLLAFWEQMVHESSGSIMEMMSGGNTWDGGSKETLALLLRECASIDDPGHVKLRALLEAFNSLQFDTIEANTALLDSGQADVLLKPQVIGVPAMPSPLAPRLNRRLLFGMPLPDAAPGNIYQPEVILSGEWNVFPTVDELLRDIAQKDKEQELKDGGSLAVAMEISPPCDYQQRKIKRARFICGVAVASKNRNLLKPQGDFIRPTPIGREAIIAFDDGPLKGDRMFLWNSHYIVSVHPAQVLPGTALNRLRQLPLMDIQAWIGSHVSRPGYLSVP